MDAIEIDIDRHHSRIFQSFANSDASHKCAECNQKIKPLSNYWVNTITCLRYHPICIRRS